MSTPQTTMERAIYNQVPTIKLDDLKLKNEKLVIKIDVEGAESRCYWGRLRRWRTIRAACHDIHGDTERLVEPCSIGWIYIHRVGHVCCARELRTDALVGGSPTVENPSGQSLIQR